jgi:CheY-like chemotaxis protein
MPKSKILVVDDNPFICELMQSRLEASGYNVVTAVNGEEALRKVKVEKPDIVLLDVTMPGMDGFQVAAEIKKDEEISDIAIVMVTAHGEHDSVIRAMSSLDIAGYVLKPFKPEELLSEIEKALSNKKTT